MGNPWLLIAAAAVTVGALLGVAGVIGLAILVAVSGVLARRGWLALLVVAVVAGGVGTLRVELRQVPELPDAVVTSYRAEVTVVRLPQTGPSGPRAVVRVDAVLLDDDRRQASGEVLVFFRETLDREPRLGDRMRVRWAVSDPATLDPGIASFIAASGAATSATPFHVSILERGSSPWNLMLEARARVTGSIADAMPADAAALVAGFVTGDDSGLSTPARSAFEATNTSHITAVSGSNVGILLGMWFWLVPPGPARRRPLGLLAATLVIWLYVALVGFGPGAVRAGLFASLLLPAAAMGRRGDPLTALATASAVMLLASPRYVDSVGFWLSLVASAALVTVAAGASASGWARVRRVVLALLAAHLATLPIVLATFGGWSPASLVANLILGPLVSLYFPVAFATAALVTILPWAGVALGWLPALGADIILAVVESIAGRSTLVRAETVPDAGIALVALLCLGGIAVLSVDARRWARRVAIARPEMQRWLTPAALGVGVGIWLAATVSAVL